jgi:phosphatidylserine decarboxylase
MLLNFMFTLRTLLEGKWPILILAGVILVTFLWCPWRWAPVVPLVLLGFVISFFRDPTPQVPAEAKLIVAPATGRIVEIKPDGAQIMVAIFLSVFDVHVQCAPIAGTIQSVTYQPGKFYDVRNPQAPSANESRLVEIVGTDGYRVTVRQIAGLIARRIVGWAGQCATVTKGERIGMIKFGSRVELRVPAGTELVAKKGDYARGGETVLARRN